MTISNPTYHFRRNMSSTLPIGSYILNDQTGTVHKNSPDRFYLGTFNDYTTIAMAKGNWTSSATSAPSFPQPRK